MVKQIKTFKQQKLSNMLKVSIIFNVFFISIIFGGAFLNPHKNNKFKMVKRNLLEKSVIHKHHKTIKQCKLELEQALLEEPYNKAKVKGAFLKLDHSMESFTNLLTYTITEKAAGLSPKERLKLLPPHLRVRKERF